MIRIGLFFLIIATLVHLSIEGFCILTGRERWALTKLLAYSIMVSLIAVSLLVAIVVIF